MLTPGMNKKLGERIRELRARHDISLRELARRLENTPAHISDIELGRRNPSEELLKKIADILGEDLEALRKYDKRPPIDAFKKIIEHDPAYGFALRTLAQKDISAEEIMEWMKKKPNRDKNK